MALLGWFYILAPPRYLGKLGSTVCLNYNIVAKGTSTTKMKASFRVAIASLAISGTSAHYIFQQFTYGGTKYPVYQYIRENSNYNSPVTDLTSNDLRCNVGASGSSTQTINVKAGDPFTFTLDTPVYHQGPVSLYMSKAPGSASSYDGSGNWFKIKDWSVTDFSKSGGEWNMAGSYTYNIPSCIPDGDYLLRIQSLAIHNPWPAGIPQFYIECAQISVTGGGSASPSPTCQIPRCFKDTDPGYTVNIYSNFNNYTVPGPAVWSCGSSGGGSSPPASSSKPATTLKTTTTTKATTSAQATTTTAPGGGSGCTAAKYAQCGGTGFTGCTTCASGSSCKVTNEYYSQCL